MWGRASSPRGLANRLFGPLNLRLCPDANKKRPEQEKGTEHLKCRSQNHKLRFSGLRVYSFFPAESDALISHSLQLLGLGGQGAETDASFFRKLSQLASCP